MRISAASIKGKGTSHIQDMPREGTKLRSVYDLCMKGYWFLLPPNIDRSVFEQLKISYDLEIEVKRRFRKPAYYRCLGRWEGANFKRMSEIEEAIEFTNKGKL